MEAINCYKCQEENSEAALFCKNCGSLLNCKNCGSVIKYGMHFCDNCGTSITNNQFESRVLNRIEFNQKGNSKSFVATFSDEVGAYFAGTFNSIVTGHPLVPKNPFQRAITASITKKIENPPNNIEANIQEAELINDDYAEIIAKIFKQNENGGLEVVDNRLKEKSVHDKIRRFLLLYFYAKKLMDIDKISREELNDIMSEQKLGGGTYRKFLSKEALKYIAQKDNGNYSLLAAGKEEAQKILTEIANPNFKVTASKAGRKAGKKSMKNSNNSTNEKEIKSNSSSKLSASETIKTLINEEYFSTKRKLNDMVTYCEEKRATKYSRQNLSAALNRLVQDQILKRDKGTDGYEYYK